MLEMKSVDAGLGLQARGSETSFNGPLGAGFDSMSASHSRVAAALRFLAAASVRVVSGWRLMVDRLSWFSFYSRGVIGFLSRLEDEGVGFEQRQRIGDEFVEQRIAQSQRWLRAAGRLRAKNVGDVVGAEGARRCSFLDRASHHFRSILTNVSSSSSVSWRDSARSVSAMSRR